MVRLSPPPLRLFRIDDTDYVPPPPRRRGSPLIETVWARIAAKVAAHDRQRDEFFSPIIAERDVAHMKAAFVAGVYAASAALNVEDASSLELSEAAARIEGAP